MSSTSNAQDLLVNVFRPTYRWESNTGFVPSMVVSNVSELIAGRIKTDKLAVTDANGNSYIGSNAGPSETNQTTFYNTALGFSAMAGASNSSNNVAVGTSNFYGLSNGNNNVGIGVNTVMTGRGEENILIGTNISLGDGSGNIIIGNDLSLGNISKTFRLGSLLYGDLSSGYVGINTSKPEAALDISGIVVFRNKVGFQSPNPVYSLDVAGSVYASEQFIGSNGTSVNPLFTFRDASGTGMYVPDSAAGFGDGAFAIAVNRAPAAVFSSNQVNFYQDLDVSGTFSARGVVLDGFAVENGTAAVPTMTFKNDSSSGLYLVASNTIGVSTNGRTRMMVLSNGDISSSRIVGSDISLSGTILSSSGCNVIGGVTLSNGNVILTGTATNTNLLVPGWFRHTDPPTSGGLDISGGNVSNSLTTRSSNFRASSGAVNVPAYSFANDASSGLHLVGTSTLGFDTAGVQRMCISGGFVGIGRAAPVVALDVLGDVSATTYNGPGGTQTAPHYTFSDDRTTGLFFPGANMIGLTAGGTERVRISNSNVGIGTRAPSNALDVSGTLRVIGVAGDITFTNGAIAIGGSNVISSTGVLSNGSTTSNSIGGVTLSGSDLSMASIGRILAPIVRNALTPSTYDISGGNISNSLTTTSSNLRVAAGSVSAPAVAFTTSTNTGLYSTTTGNLDVATAGSRCMNLAPGGVTTYLGLRAAGAAPQLTINATSGTYNAISFNSTAAGSLAIGNQVGSIPDGQFGVSTDGGSTASLRVATSGIVVPGHIRDALAPSTLDISGGNISNSGVTRSTNFLAVPGGAPRPGFAFTTDPSSGIDLPGTSQIAFETAGVQRMVLSNSVLAVGRTPLTDTSLILQTASNAYISTGRVYLGDPANSIAAYGGTIVEGLSNGGSGACDLLLYSRPTGAAPTTPLERMRILGSGNIGIGTRAPGATLDVSGTIRSGFTTGSELTTNAASIEIAGGINGSGVGGLPAIAFQGRDGAGGFGYRHFIQSVHSGGTSSTANALRFFLSTGGTVGASTAPGTGNVCVMAVTRLGVGIGTIDPVTQLQVDSDAVGFSTIRAFAGGAGTASSNNIPRLQLSSRVASGAVLDYNITGEEVNTANNYGLSFGGYGNSNLARMDFGNRRMGINTTAPGYSLDVSSGDGYALRVTNRKALFDVEFQGSSQEYAVTSLNGYFGIYKAGTTNKATSNIMVSLSPDTGAPCYILSNRLAIGQMTAGCALDVSVGNSEIAGRFRVAGLTGNTNVLEFWAPTSSTTEPNRRIGLATNENTGTNIGNDFLINMYNDSGGYYSTPFILKRGTGRVGIGPYQPGYALDVTATETSNAAINASTWTRAAGSNVMVCVGSPGRTNNVINWSNASPAMSSDLISFVASNATTGAYFRILKSGIWSIHAVSQGQDSGAYLSIDASTNTNQNGTSHLTMLARNSGYQASVNYIGYLSSNASMYYKVIGYFTEVGNKGQKLSISFLQELPDITPTFPAP